ncbi:hypothetical protein GCM10027610_040100 [Dactylosporangium cerinum]
MEVFQGARVEVISDRSQPRQLDGDLIEAAATLSVEVMPDVLWLCVPQPAADPDLAEDADAAARRAAVLLDDRGRPRR